MHSINRKTQACEGEAQSKQSLFLLINVLMSKNILKRLKEALLLHIRYILFYSASMLAVTGIIPQTAVLVVVTRITFSRI